MLKRKILAILIIICLFTVLENKSVRELKRQVGLTHEQFSDLFESLPSLQCVYKNPVKATNSLYMFLMKIRTGQPDEDIGIFFGCSISTIERGIKAARASLETDFVSQYINVVLPHEEILQHSTVMSRILFGGDNKAIVICDGTYIYLNKSQNYEFQKNTYSGQKKRNFIRIMMVVLCDGRILHALGPYKATQNDASILKEILETTNAFSSSQPGDIFLLDRGFRDCLFLFKKYSKNSNRLLTLTFYQK